MTIFIHDETNMAWGIFNKIGKGMKQGFDFVKNKVMPIANKVIEVTKPFVEGTKYGMYVEKAEKFKSIGQKYVDRTDKVVNAFKGTGGRKMMPQLKFEELDDGEDEEFDE